MEEKESNKVVQEEVSPVEEGVVVVQSTSSEEDHVIIHLPPTLHKGNRTLLKV